MIGQKCCKQQYNINNTIVLKREKSTTAIASATEGEGAEMYFILHPYHFNSFYTGHT